MIARNRRAIVLFSPEAIRHYLPAYLTVALDDPDLAGLVVVVLDPGAKPASRSAFDARFGGLDAAQRSAVASFLRSLRDRADTPLDADAARIALERGWET